MKMKSHWLPRIILGCLLVVFLTLQLQTPLVDRNRISASSQGLAERRSPNLSKRVNIFRTAIAGLCRLCGDYMPEPEDQAPLPVQVVDLQPPGSKVYQLWASIRERDKAQTGGRVAANLDVNQPARYGATQIYGCTVVVVLDGRGIFIGHYPEVAAGGEIAMDDRAAAELEIVDPLVERLGNGDIDISTAAQVWVVHNIPSTIQSSLAAQMFTRRRPGWQAIVEALTTEFGIQEKNIKSQPYQSKKPEGNDHLGKVIVDWIPMSDGGANMNIYFNNPNPVWYVFDAKGNNCGLEGESPAN